MSNRRRANNKSRSGRNQRTGPRPGAIDLDDLDAALKATVEGGDSKSDTSSSDGSSRSRDNHDVKVTINSAEERRFVMHSTNIENATGIFSSQNKNREDDPIFQTHNQPIQFEKHQENFSATKYIKPWRTGTKSQVLPPKSGFKSNKGKGGKMHSL